MNTSFNGIMNELTELTKPYFAYIMSIKDQTDPSSVVHNGTITFLHMGDKHLGITCKHVYDALVKDMHKSDCIVAIGGSRHPIIFDLEDSVLSMGSDGIDLVSLTIDPLLPSAIGASFITPVEWPPERVEPGEVVYLQGCPEEGRSADGNTLVQLCVGLEEFVTSSSERHFVLACEDRAARERCQNIPGFDITTCSGMSGSAAYHVYRNDASIQVKLAGIAYEFRCESGDIGSMTFMVHHADYIGEDGSILHTP